MENTNNKSEWSEREVGALWKKDGQNQKYLTGKVKIDGVEKNIVVFSNKHKNKDSQPDFRMYLSRDRQLQGDEQEKPVEEVSQEVPQEELL
jgi:uncharacterized protein (DUF736 family)